MMRPPTILRSRAISRRCFLRTFTTTTPLCSILFNLGGLASSRESQYLSREHGIPRTEYSSNIHLIRSSEVDPFAPAPGASKHAKATNHNDPPRRATTAAPTTRLLPKREERTKGTTHDYQASVDLAAAPAPAPAAAAATTANHNLAAQLQRATEEIAQLKTAVDALQWRADRIPLAIMLGTPLLVFVGVVGHLFWEEHQADLADAAAAAAAAQARSQAQAQAQAQARAQAETGTQTKIPQLEAEVRAVRPETRMERRARDPNRHFLDAFFWAPGTFGK